MNKDIKSIVKNNARKLQTLPNAKKMWKIYQFDVKPVHLKGCPKEKIYIKLL